MLATALIGMQATSILPPTNPPWPPTYDMAMSTLSMQCNSSGWSDPVRGAAFGIISYDWSNAKAQWAAARPMDCEEQLQTQARLTKYANPKSNVFVYRNVVKALPWFTSVREKLDDPRYAGWFLRFDKSKAGQYNVPDCAAENASKCSVFYHDQEQTPAVPTPAAPHPDGSCGSGVCDCGEQPCGEYLFDHRNGSMLREWIVNELILGPTGVGDAAIDGLFIDDYWCSDLICKDDPAVAGCPCGDPVQGPTEEDKHSQADMGLSDEAIRDLTIGWNATMEAVQRGIVAAGGYTWSLMLGQENANAAPRMLKHDTCAAQLRAACVAGSDWQRHSILFGLTTNGSKLVQVKQDVAFFLLARGAYRVARVGRVGHDMALQSRARARRITSAAPRRAASHRDRHRLRRAAGGRLPRDLERRLRAALEPRDDHARLQRVCRRIRSEPGGGGECRGVARHTESRNITFCFKYRERTCG